MVQRSPDRAGQHRIRAITGQLQHRGNYRAIIASGQLSHQSNHSAIIASVCACSRATQADALRMATRAPKIERGSISLMAHRFSDARPNRRTGFDIFYSQTRARTGAQYGELRASEVGRGQWGQEIEEEGQPVGVVARPKKPTSVWEKMGGKGRGEQWSIVVWQVVC